MLWALYHVRHYSDDDRQYKVVTDCSALTWLFRNRELCPKMQRWALRLTEQYMLLSNTYVLFYGSLQRLHPMFFCIFFVIFRRLFFGQSMWTTLNFNPIFFGNITKEITCPPADEASASSCTTRLRPRNEHVEHVCKSAGSMSKTVWTVDV